MYGIYKTSGRIASSSEYKRDVYANALLNVLSNTTPCEETILCVICTYMRYPFDVVGFQQRYHENLFVFDEACLTLLCQHVRFPFIQHINRIKHVCLILKVLLQLKFCVALLVHCTGLQSV